MKDLILDVLGLGVWTPAFPGLAAWTERAPEPLPERVKAPVLDRQCSRRASLFSKSMALAFSEATTNLDRASTPTVFGSALGETAVMLKLLEQMIQGDDDFSPMAFAVSVHNAASGLVSISTKNRAFTTSLAADHDTPAMGLVEAWGVSRRFNAPVVLVCGDEAVPDGLVGDHERFDHLAVAVAVSAAHLEEVPSIARLSGFALDGTGGWAENVPPALTRNPQAGLLDLVERIAHRRPGRVRLDRGRGSGWSAEVVPL